MYINETYTSTVGGDCKSCENRSICKWTSEKESQKQDGFYLKR